MKKKLVGIALIGFITLGSATGAYAFHDQIKACIDSTIAFFNPAIQTAANDAYADLDIDEDVRVYVEQTYGSIEAYAEQLKKDAKSEVDAYYIKKKAELETKLAQEEKRAKNALKATKDQTVADKKAAIDTAISEAVEKACTKKSNNGVGNGNTPPGHEDNCK